MQQFYSLCFSSWSQVECLANPIIYIYREWDLILPVVLLYTIKVTWYVQWTIGVHLYMSITQKVIHACYPAACTLQPVEQTVWLLSHAFLARIAANSVLARAVSVMEGQVGWKTVWWSPSQSVGKMLTLHVITVSYWSNIIILTCTCANLSHHHTILYNTYA